MSAEVRSGRQLGGPQSVPLTVFAIGLGSFLVPFEVTPSLSLTGFDLVRGALSGGAWSMARIALAALLGFFAVGFVWSAFRLFLESSARGTPQ